MTTTPHTPIRIALADDHQLMREGLRRLLNAETGTGIEIVAEVQSGPELLVALRRTPVDVAVLDLSMPGLSGMELIKLIKTEFPALPVLVLTMHAEEQYAVRAFSAGAKGYLTKDAASEQLVEAIHKLAQGGAHVTPSIAERLALGLHRVSSGPRHADLSDREFEILREIVAGKRLTDIANDLNLSIKTVSTHKAHIMEKLGLDSTAALVRYGMQQRLFEDDAVAQDTAVG